MYIPLSLHTHYSLLRGLSNPSALVKSLAEKNIGVAALTDFDKVSGAVSFSKACDEAGIKPILGSKIFISDDGGYVTVIAKNRAGWQELIRLSSISHDKEHIKSVPQVSFDELAGMKNIIVLSGEPESTLANSMVAKSLAYSSQSPKDHLSFFLHDNWADRVTAKLDKYKAVFGENFFVAIQRMNQYECPIDREVADSLSYLSDNFGIKRVGVPNEFYLNKSDKSDQNLLLCSQHKLRFGDLDTLVESEQYAALSRFVKNDNCHLPTSEEMETVYTEEELGNTRLIGDMCDAYSILANPTLPNFDTPNNMPQSDYLRQLCRDGWKRLNHKLDKTRQKEYVDRVEEEFKVFNEANLSGYFLIVQDFVKWAKNQGVLIGCGRGSAGGCLVSYLTDIITIDPILNDLYFERFYNAGRNSPGKISLPDIDVDVPVFFRERMFEYLRGKYGFDHVSQVCTFSSLQGRGAIKEVLRVNGACTQDVMNDITRRIPQKAAIEDKLEEAKEKSIIRWTLGNDPSALKDWCVMEDDGTLSGPMAQYFEQAIRIEGTYKSYGKHASALIIGAVPIDEVCPMINDKKTGNLIAGVEYDDGADALGLPKFDILGLSTLDKLMGVNQLLKTGKLSLTIDEPSEEEEDEE